jgi:prepilin-type N-terminal cleavage/methylation domain-containing protein
MSQSKSRCAFTLIELLVALAIITTLTAITVPAIMKVREASHRTICANNLRQIAIAIHNYHGDIHHFPFGQVGPYKKVPNSPYYGWGADSTGWSFLAIMLPYVEEDKLFAAGRVPQATLRQSGIADKKIKLFLCPSDNAFLAGPRSDSGNLQDFPVGNTNYKGVSGSNWGFDKGEDKWLATDWKHLGTNKSYDGLIENDGLLSRNDIFTGKFFASVQDGLSNTFMLGEDLPEKNRWLSWPYANGCYGTCAIPPNVKRPGGGDYDPYDWHNVWSFRSRHPHGVQFAFADASVRFVIDSLDLDLYRAFATIAGGEVVDVSQLD